MLKLWLDFLQPKFIGGIIDAIGRNFKADVRMSREKSNQWQTSREDHLNDVQWNRQQQTLRQNETFHRENRNFATIGQQAQRAREAGLHPLFALSGGGGGGGGFSGAGYAPSVQTSGARNFIDSNRDRQSGNVGAAVDAMVAGKQRKQRQSGMDKEMQLNNASTRRLQDSRSALNETEYMRLNSDDAMSIRDAWDTRNNAGPSDFQALPAEITSHRSSGRDLTDRPVTETARKSVPARQEVIGPDGERYSVINTEYDEIAQADLIYQMAVRKVYRNMWKNRNKGVVIDVRGKIAALKAKRDKAIRQKKAHRGTLGPVRGFRKRSAR